MNLEQGKKLVKLARLTIKNKLENKTTKNSDFKEKGACFVTLLTYPAKHLRGCIGYIQAVFPLSNAIINSALNAAFSDPRFEHIDKEELDKILVEVSVLTEPKILKVSSPKDYLKKIELGKHGLIIELEEYRGLLLPQVPIEQKWSVEEFLENTCLKAGLLEDTWQQGTCKIYTFETKIFAEEKPNGNIKEIKLKQ